MSLEAEGAQTIDRHALPGIMESIPYELKDYLVDEESVQIEMINANIAVIAYKVREQFVKEGRSSTQESFDSTVWVRRDGRWVAVLHTETPAKTAA